MGPTRPLLQVAIVLATSTFGCYARVPEDVLLLRWLKKADPIADAKMALAKGDHRLRAVYGLTVFIPGTNSKDFPSLKQHYGINIIEGTSDCIISKEHGQLVELAYQYSKTYNLYLLDKHKSMP
jgi:hypothetical protein